MKNTTLACALALVAAMHAAAATLVYVAPLAGSSEAPPNASPGGGYGLITFDTALNTMRVQVVFANLVGMTTASHIHCCTSAPRTGTAGVATQLPTFTGFPLGVASGTYDHTFDLTQSSAYNTGATAFFNTLGGGTAAGAETALLNGVAAGTAYLNIHSTFRPGGEIRGFLVAAPEPATFVFTGLGLAGAFLGRKRLARG